MKQPINETKNSQDALPFCHLQMSVILASPQAGRTLRGKRGRRGGILNAVFHAVEEVRQPFVHRFLPQLAVYEHIVKIVMAVLMQNKLPGLSRLGKGPHHQVGLLGENIEIVHAVHDQRRAVDSG